MPTSTAHEATVTLYPDKNVEIEMQRVAESSEDPDALRPPQNAGGSVRPNPALALHCLAAYSSQCSPSFNFHVTGDPCLAAGL